MAKDPAFLFYVKDFLTGVADLTMEERGQYITLLCLQHQKGHLNEKVININVPNAAADVLAKFSRDENGLFFNSRLDEEKTKRAQHTEKQRQRALDGWKKRKSEQATEYTTANAAALPLGNGNANEDVIVIKDSFEGGMGETFTELQPTFEEFWEAYDKKTGKKEKIRSKWVKLKQSEKEAIMEYIPAYKLSQPDKRFRKNPETFLNNDGWKDEIILSENKLKEMAAKNRYYGNY